MRASLPCARRIDEVAPRAATRSRGDGQKKARRDYFALVRLRVAISRRPSQASASSRVLPHISSEACSPLQHEGRAVSPNRAQRRSSVSCAQRIPAGLPAGMPGMALDIDGAMQQAPHPGRQFIASFASQVSLSRRSQDRCAILGEASAGHDLFMTTSRAGRNRTEGLLESPPGASVAGVTRRQACRYS